LTRSRLVTNPLLSICIATYNRAGYIGETVASIVPQLDEDVELLIVDGASTDDTEAVVRDIAAKEPRIRYVRLAAKGGVDRDYDRSVELARGEFCWLFTDDDLIRPGAVSAVRRAIGKGYGLVVVNAEVRDRQLTTVLERRRVHLEEDKAYPAGDADGLFADALSYLSFIGAVVIRRSLWLGRDRASFFGTEFVHIGVLFQQPLPEPALVIAHPYVWIRYGNAQWTDRSFDIWMFKWPRLVWSFPQVSDDAKQRVTRKEPWRNLRTLVVQRSLGSFGIPAYRQHLANARASALWKFCALLIARCPRKIIVECHSLHSRIRGSEVRAAFDATVRDVDRRAGPSS
jgi:abequosyltransferase